MSDTVLHVIGHVGSDVEHKVVAGGMHLSSFRLATTPRHWSKAKGMFVDDVTNWLTVQCWRSLAVNVATSVHRGQPVVVVGRLKTQEWVKDGIRNSRLFLEATAVGHDLSRGVTSFTKASASSDPMTQTLRAVPDTPDPGPDGGAVYALAGSPADPTPARERMLSQVPR